MGFTEELAEIDDPIWDAIVDHPTGEQLGEDSPKVAGGEHSW